MDLPFIACELGGAGTVSVSALESGWEVLMRVLLKNEVIAHDHSFLCNISNNSPQTCFVDMSSNCTMVTANFDGLFSPLYELGATAKKGDKAGYIYSLQNGIAPLEELESSKDGVIVIKRRDTLVRSGDHLFCVAPTLTRDGVLSK
jgi:predicted deacylase